MPKIHRNVNCLLGKELILWRTLKPFWCGHFWQFWKIFLFQIISGIRSSLTLFLLPGCLLGLHFYHSPISSFSRADVDEFVSFNWRWKRNLWKLWEYVIFQRFSYARLDFITSSFSSIFFSASTTCLSSKYFLIFRKNHVFHGKRKGLEKIFCCSFFSFHS